jgi:hypothetical protein
MSLDLVSFLRVRSTASASRQLASSLRRVLAFIMPALVAAWMSAVPRDAAAATQAEPKDAAGDESKATKASEKEQNDPLARFKFGGAIGVSMDLMSGEPVSEAAVVNGLVRSTRTATARPRVLLEVHRPFITFGPKPRAVRARLPERTADGRERGTEQVVGISERAGWAVGPFAAIQSGGSSVVDGFAAGVMVSILRDASTGADFNIGVGAMLDEKVKFLGDGVVDGQPLPPGETEVRFKEKAGWSLVILFSVGQ